MKKQNLLKFNILVIAVLFTTAEAFSATSVVETLTVSSPPTVAITKNSTSVETGQVNPVNGSHAGLNASFNIVTNGTDDDYTFIVGSKITSYGNTEVSAYTNDGTGLLFGRVGEEEHLPTTESIENAKSGGNDNPNIIVYPISSMTIDSPMTVNYDPAQENNENSFGCYVVKVNGGTEGTLKQVIGGSAMNDSYNISQDMAGSYKTTVYFTAISK